VRVIGDHRCFLLRLNLALLMVFGFHQGINAQSAAQLASGVLNVIIRTPQGSRADVQAIVTLYNSSNNPLRVGSPSSGQLIFTGLDADRYTLEVVATGFQKLIQPVDIQISGQHQQVSIELVPDTGKNPQSTSSVPILAPNARKNLDRVLEDLRTGRLEDAKSHLEKVSRTAPSYPDVTYLWGVYYLQAKNSQRAKENWGKTLQVDPRHVFALAALAQMATDAGDLPGAIGYLERATEAQPTSWLYQDRLAVAYMNQGDLEKAETHAVRATQVGKGHAADTQLILAQVLLKRNDRPRAIQALDAFLSAEPNSPKAPSARQLIESLQIQLPETQPAAPEVPASLIAPATVPSSSSPVRAKADAAAGNPPSSAVDYLPTQRWIASDVDEAIPPVEPGIACPLEKMKQETGERVHDFINAVNRISATEFLENETIDPSGLPKRRETRRYNYIVAVTRINQGMVDFQEYRNGSRGIDDFPEHIASLGLPTMVMVFDPAFRDSYDFSCEGLSHWRGGLAWQVHFRQRPDKPARLRGYRVAGNFYSVPVRGRAWVTTDSFQVVTMETDIVAPIPAIRLKTEHSFIEYAPVQFRKDQQVLWLPESAELFFDFRGHRMHRRHYFRNYQLFSVDETQQISDPKAKLESNTPQVPQ
jgi:tetratricopeptide (TPR) repeat protein